jgi:LmeA-like phospholipid-binding
VPATDTRPIPVQAPPRRRRRHPLRNTVIVLVVLLGLLVVAAVVGDGVFRASAEAQIARSVEQSLPQGVTGTVHAKVRGTSAIQQWLHGSFDDVDLTTRNLKVQGAPASAHLVAHGLPVSGSGAIRSASGTLTVGQGAIDRLAPIAAADAGRPRLGNGTVSTSLQRTVLGLPIDVDVTLKPSVQGSSIHLEPTAARLRSGAVSVPGTALIQTLLPDGITVCTAQYLPPGVRLTALDTRPGFARLGLAARDPDLEALQRGEHGSCPS